MESYFHISLANEVKPFYVKDTQDSTLRLQRQTESRAWDLTGTRSHCPSHPTNRVVCPNCSDPEERYSRWVCILMRWRKLKWTGQSVLLQYGVSWEGSVWMGVQQNYIPTALGLKRKHSEWILCGDITFYYSIPSFTTKCEVHVGFIVSYTWKVNKWTPTWQQEQLQSLHVQGCLPLWIRPFPPSPPPPSPYV